MRTRPALALVLAGSLLAAAISGCVVTGNRVGDPYDASDVTEALSDASDDVADVFDDLSEGIDGLSDLVDLPNVLAEALGSEGGLSKASRLVVADAQTEETVATHEEGGSLDDATRTLAGLSFPDWEVVPSHPDAEGAEYVLSLYQSETLRFGQSERDLSEVEAFRITTYEGSRIIEFTVVDGLVSFDLELPEGDVAALRGLAVAR